MLRLALYARVSTTERTPEIQSERLRSYARRLADSGGSPMEYGEAVFWKQRSEPVRISATVGLAVCLLCSSGCQRNEQIDKAISDRIDQRIEEALAPEKAEVAALKGTVEGLDRRIAEIEHRVQSGMGPGMMGPGMMQGPSTSTTPTPSEPPKQ
jgi:hypothetical protein